MKLTWHGHSAFAVETGGKKILIDPFITGNPSAVQSVDQIAKA
jgi:L-ascorbate metabolism protein UlaG (beta-lactamase superfamily)